MRSCAVCDGGQEKGGGATTTARYNPTIRLSGSKVGSNDLCLLLSFLLCVFFTSYWCLFLFRWITRERTQLIKRQRDAFQLICGAISSTPSNPVVIQRTLNDENVIASLICSTVKKKIGLMQPESDEAFGTVPLSTGFIIRSQGSSSSRQY